MASFKEFKVIKIKIKCRFFYFFSQKNVRRAPFYLVSVGNALILTTSTVLHDYCDKYVCTSNKFTNIDFLRGIITVECIFVMFMWFYYSRQVRLDTLLKKYLLCFVYFNFVELDGFLTSLILKIPLKLI